MRVARYDTVLQRPSNIWDLESMYPFCSVLRDSREHDVSLLTHFRHRHLHRHLHRLHLHSYPPPPPPLLHTTSVKLPLHSGSVKSNALYPIQDLSYCHHLIRLFANGYDILQLPYYVEPSSTVQTSSKTFPIEGPMSQTSRRSHSFLIQ